MCPAPIITAPGGAAITGTTATQAATPAAAIASARLRAGMFVSMTSAQAVTRTGSWSAASPAAMPILTRRCSSAQVAASRIPTTGEPCCCAAGFGPRYTAAQQHGPAAMPDNPKPDPDAERRDAVLRRMLATPKIERGKEAQSGATRTITRGVRQEAHDRAQTHAKERK